MTPRPGLCTLAGSTAKLPEEPLDNRRTRADRDVDTLLRGLDRDLAILEAEAGGAVEVVARALRFRVAAARARFARSRRRTVERVLPGSRAPSGVILRIRRDAGEATGARAE